MKPTPKKPSSSIAQVEASGTAVTTMFAEPTEFPPVLSGKTMLVANAPGRHHRHQHHRRRPDRIGHDGAAIGLHEALLCRQTGKIYWRSDLDELEELPDDIEDDEKYIAIPDKRELDLGKPLVQDFAREFLPNDFDEVRYIFSKRGAYQKFRALVTRRRVLERWYEFESKATERALREWCELNSIEVTG